MYPKSHLKSLKRSRLKKRVYRSISILILFSFSLLLIGPMIHETTHVAWLEQEGCEYSLALNIGWSGLYGAVKPICHLPDMSLIIFYSGGFLSTLTVGAILNLAATELHEKTKRYIYPLAAGTGLMLSVVIGIMAKGDFAEIFKIIGFNQLHSEMFTAALMVSIFVSNFKSIDVILSELEWEE